MLRNDRDGDGVDPDSNTYADAYAITYGHGDAYADTYAHAYAISYAHAHPITISYANTYAVTITDAYAITITYAHAYAITYAHCPCQCHSNASRKNIADAKAASDSGAASHTRRSDSCHVHSHAERHAWRSYGCSS
jgi:hypothetical protein